MFVGGILPSPEQAASLCNSVTWAALLLLCFLLASGSTANVRQTLLQ